jgi:hypothetical protein
MAYKSGVDWVRARAYYESGHSQGETARRFKVSRTAVGNHLEAEGWTHDVSQSLRQATEAKIAGILPGGNPVKTAAAIDEEAERRAAVILEHRKEWQIVGAMRNEAITKSRTDISEGFEAQKMAKITAEVTAIKQACERKAWGIDVTAAGADAAKSNDARQLSDADIDRLIVKYERQREDEAATVQ